jgi:hypothetical protein
VSDPLRALLEAGALPVTSYPPNSRYHGVPVTRFLMPNGEIVSYLRRRFVPRPELFALVQEHRVAQGERPDTLAAKYLGDPELYYRLCDANRVLAPKELVEEIGRGVRITLPAGMPGPGETDA